MLMRREPQQALTGKSLDGLCHGEWADVLVVDVPLQEARWLAAMGVHEGARIVVMRRAALGGPLQVRTASGGAFALGAALAQRVRVGCLRTVA